ncbi:hypothetical protein ACFVS2_21435 [Brevibacillus sp. NPDC058079]|uniref:hypothetical protein n=1 Tax=Brevibacillus sp. NPDC058079 TaxID=3346330 RepID=UPI0036E93179
MQLSWEQFQLVINKKLRYNQLLLVISIVLAVIFFFVQRENLLWSGYFLLIGSLSLPNINRCKEDIELFKNNRFASETGKVLDVFPEKEGGSNWIIFLETDSSTNKKDQLLEFVVPAEPGVKETQVVTVHYTPKMSIPVRIDLEEE